MGSQSGPHPQKMETKCLRLHRNHAKDIFLFTTKLTTVENSLILEENQQHGTREAQMQRRLEAEEEQIESY